MCVENVRLNSVNQYSWAYKILEFDKSSNFVTLTLTSFSKKMVCP